VEERKAQSAVSEDDVRSQLERILGHAEFHATDKMRDFLRYVVEETLAGNARGIKGFTIAVEVFGRDQDFDPAHDPVVRIQASRLRLAIERYYLVAGGVDPIRIDIPKGGYVPVFSRPAGPPERASPRAGLVKAQLVASWPSVLVLPFEDMTGDAALGFLAPGLATELCMELGQCADLRVMLAPEQAMGARPDTPVPDFLVRGTVRCQDSEVKIVVQLVGGASGEQLWVDSVRASPADARLLEFQENAAACITAQIAGEHGVIFRVLSSSATRGPIRTSTNHQAILKGYAYHLKVDPTSLATAYRALREAHAEDPSCGLVCTMLAVIFLDNLALEFLDTDLTPLDEALRLAREGARIEPGNPLARLALARAYLLENELASGLVEVEAALALNPGSPLFMDAAGYLMTLLGEWDRGEELVREAIRLNPFYRLFARYATWLNAFRRGDYQEALEESRWLVGVASFWDPLCRAATLGKLGRQVESRQAVQELLDLKPDFPQRGLVLISHFVKFPAIRDDIVAGLAAGGLRLEPTAPERTLAGTRL
jgi:adenylate cyclase